MDQQTATEILQSGENVFITGAPGTGKTYVIDGYRRFLSQHCLQAAVTASTGIAASHIGGMTLHAFAGLGISDKLTQDDIKKILEKRHVASRMNKITTLIIDEISMVLPHTFRSVDRILRAARLSVLPFGGIQVVISGDFFQLPPVRTKKDSEEMYVWQTELWKDLDLTICYLEESYRHEDSELTQILDEIRAGEVNEGSREALQSRHNASISPDSHTKLYTHNIDVDKINAKELQKLPGQAKGFRAGCTGNQKLADAILGSTLIMPIFAAKIGARVVFIRNNQEKEYVNGTLGTVVAFEDETNYPIVEIEDGRHIVATPEEWVREGDRGEIIAGIRQIPLRLAWALTIHKSQGMTLDAAEIDLSRSFEVGQGYVALSRIKNLDGLSLLGANETALEVDNRVREFDNELRQQSQEQEEVQKDTSNDQKEENKENFICENGGTIYARNISTNKKETPSKVTTIEKTKELVDVGHSIALVAQKRRLKEPTIIEHIIKIKTEDKDWDITDLLPPNKVINKVDQVQSKIIKDGRESDLQENGKPKLSAIYTSLGEKYSYEEIKLALLAKHK